jgi:alanyl-tRNA synthetase
MQQHSGEHMVSGLLHGRFGCHNVGFHVGADTVTIDFDMPIPPEALAEVELEANRAIWANMPLKCWYPSREELPTVPYRRKRELPWPVRIVEVPGCDTCACCGVHVATTGQIGLVKLLSCVKFHQGVRIEMVCGGRALDLLSRVYDQNRQVSQAFSAKILETGEAARRMNDALSQEKYRAAGLERQLLERIAEDYRDKGDTLCFLPNLSGSALRDLADKIADTCGGTAAVFTGTDGSYQVCMVSRTDDLRQRGKDLNAALNGRGGGKPGFFQGSVSATREDIEKFFQT